MSASTAGTLSILSRTSRRSSSTPVRRSCASSFTRASHRLPNDLARTRTLGARRGLTQRADYIRRNATLIFSKFAISHPPVSEYQFVLPVEITLRLHCRHRPRPCEAPVGSLTGKRDLAGSTAPRLSHSPTRIRPHVRRPLRHGPRIKCEATWKGRRGRVLDIAFLGIKS